MRLYAYTHTRLLRLILIITSTFALLCGYAPMRLCAYGHCYEIFQYPATGWAWRPLRLMFLQERPQRSALSLSAD